MLEYFLNLRGKIVMKPSIIGSETGVIDLGSLDDLSFTIEDDLISPSKRDINACLNYRAWIRYQGEVYYFKEFKRDICYIGELLGEKVSEYFGLTNAHYELAKGFYKTYHGVCTVYGVMSKLVRDEKCEYTPFQQIIDRPYGGIDFLKDIARQYPNEPLNDELKAFLIRDFYTSEMDRHIDELLIQKKENAYHFGYLIDNEAEFKESSVIENTNLYRMSYRDPDYCDMVSQDEVFQKNVCLALKLDLLELLKELKETKKIRTKTRDIDLEEYISDFQNFQRTRFQNYFIR